MKQEAITGFDVENEQRLSKRYTSPCEIGIGGIPAVVVDPHNEVFGYWYNRFYGKEPATLVHIDAHEDDVCGVRNWDNNVGLELMSKRDVGDYPHQYAMRKLDCGSFIVPAFFYDLVSKGYWLKPTAGGDPIQGFSGDVDIYDLTDSTAKGLKKARIWNGSRGIIRKGNEKNPRYLISVGNGLTPEANEQNTAKFASMTGVSPSILDIDLDAFELQDPRGFVFYENGHRKYTDAKIKATFDLLAVLPRPDLITIARSQTPDAYCPPKSVDSIQERVVDGLRRLYEDSRGKR